MVRWVVLGLPQAGACTDLFENLSEISLKGDLSNATTFNPPLFSLVNTFKAIFGLWSEEGLKRDISNEPYFSRIHIAGQYL